MLKGCSGRRSLDAVCTGEADRLAKWCTRGDLSSSAPLSKTRPLPRFPAPDTDCCSDPRIYHLTLHAARLCAGSKIRLFGRKAFLPINLFGGMNTADRVSRIPSAIGDTEATLLRRTCCTRSSYSPYRRVLSDRSEICASRQLFDERLEFARDRFLVERTHVLEGDAPGPIEYESFRNSVDAPLDRLTP